MLQIPVQEVAFTLANGIAYVEEVLRSGVPVDAFAPRLAFYFVTGADFFEEVAKFRAARRLWARIMKERFGATRPESMRLRFHCQTAAITLTKAQPMNNIVRTAFQALSAVLGGAQSLHTNGLDEAYAIPSEQAMKIALRTQQMIAQETRVADVVDPLGGSYYVEALTNQIEAEVLAILGRVDQLGGTVKALEEGYFQREIADSAYRYACRKASGEQIELLESGELRSALANWRRTLADTTEDEFEVRRITNQQVVPLLSRSIDLPGSFDRVLPWGQEPGESLAAGGFVAAQASVNLEVATELIGALALRSFYMRFAAQDLEALLRSLEEVMRLLQRELGERA